MISTTKRRREASAGLTAFRSILPDRARKGARRTRVGRLARAAVVQSKASAEAIFRFCRTPDASNDKQMERQLAGSRRTSQPGCQSAVTSQVVIRRECRESPTPALSIRGLRWRRRKQLREIRPKSSLPALEPRGARNRVRRHRHQPALHVQDRPRPDRRQARRRRDPRFGVADSLDIVHHHQRQICRLRDARRQ